MFDTKIDENISGSLRNPDLLSSIDKIFEDKNIPDFEIEIRNKAVLRLNITIYLDKNNLFFDEVTCVLFIRDLTEFHKFQQLKSDFVANVSHELRTPLQSIKMGLETIGNIKDLKEEKIVWTIVTGWRSGSSNNPISDDGLAILIDEIMTNL